MLIGDIVLLLMRDLVKPHGTGIGVCMEKLTKAPHLSWFTAKLGHRRHNNLLMALSFKNCWLKARTNYCRLNVPPWRTFVDVFSTHRRDDSNRRRQRRHRPRRWKMKRWCWGQRRRRRRRRRQSRKNERTFLYPFFHFEVPTARINQIPGNSRCRRLLTQMNGFVHKKMQQSWKKKEKCLKYRSRCCCCHWWAEGKSTH